MHYKEPQGFSILELLVVVVVISLVSSLALPKIRDAAAKASVRSAKSAFAGHVARTRESAVGRGCKTVLHLTSGATSRAWITSCRRGDIGRTISIDTIGTVDFIAARFGVTVTTTLDSIVFDRRGIAVNLSLSTIALQGAMQTTDTLTVNADGRVVLK